MIGEHDYHPPIPEPTHTVMPVRVPVQGRRIAIAVDEEHDHVYGQPHGFIWVLDVTDLADIKPLSTFQLSEMESPWSRSGRASAPTSTRSTSTTRWSFRCGSRAACASSTSPTRILPKEVGHFIPEPVNGHAAPQSNDVEVDGRGLIYVIDRLAGFDILEYQR